MKPVMMEKFELEVRIGSNDDTNKNKEKRVDLRNRLDVSSLHLRLIGDYKKLPKGKKRDVEKNLRELVIKTLEEVNVEVVENIDLGRCSLVQFPGRIQAKNALEAIQKLENINRDMRFTVCWPTSLVTVVEKPGWKPADMVSIEKKRRTNLEALERVGFSNTCIGT